MNAVRIQGAGSEILESSQQVFIRARPQQSEFRKVADADDVQKGSDRVRTDFRNLGIANLCVVELEGGCTRRANLVAPARARHRLAFAQRHRARSMGDASLSPEESIFRDYLTVCRIPEELMADFRRCTMGTTAELMTVAGGALEMKPLPEGALEAALVSLAHGGSPEWGSAAGTAEQQAQHATMLARLALLCALCRDDFDAARARMIASHRAAHGIPGSSLTMELRKKLKADPRPKVTEMIRAAELLYNTELTRARECDPSTILESLFALEDGELKIAALRSDAYGGSTTILREEERRDQSRVLVREEAQSGAKIYRIAQSLSRIEGCLETLVVVGAQLKVDKSQYPNSGEYGKVNVGTPDGAPQPPLHKPAPCPLMLPALTHSLVGE